MDDPVLRLLRIDRHAADGVEHRSGRGGAMVMCVFGVRMVVMVRHT